MPGEAEAEPSPKADSSPSKIMNVQEGPSVHLKAGSNGGSGRVRMRKVHVTNGSLRLSTASVSLSLSPEIAKMIDELAKVAVLSLWMGLLMKLESLRQLQLSSIVRWLARSLLFISALSLCLWQIGRRSNWSASWECSER